MTTTRSSYLTRNWTKMLTLKRMSTMTASNGVSNGVCW